MSSSLPIPPSTAYSDQAVSLLCQRDENNEEPLPDICRQIFNNYLEKLKDNLENDSNEDLSNAVDSEIIENHPFVRLLSMLGIFAGVVMILVLLAYFTCVRKRKDTEESSGENLTNSPVITQPQFSTYNIQPPDYAAVLRQEEEELPSYSEAVKSCVEGR
eukprot:GFUD01130285.1.p1 GENE.GFUD01130285.1~~GFUD01130285.1.p1  ORF type:complete len:160 (+),score=49.28 GFUD01130285.1:68-547(+)